MNHFIGDLLQVEILLSINQKRFQPSTTQLPKTLLHILFPWADGLLTRFAFEKGTHEGLAHSHDLSIHLVLKLPLIS